MDWADPDDEPDDHTMSQVKVLYVRNLTSEVSENDVKDLFLSYGNIERVRKVRVSENNHDEFSAFFFSYHRIMLLFILNHVMMH